MRLTKLLPAIGFALLIASIPALGRAEPPCDLKQVRQTARLAGEAYDKAVTEARVARKHAKEDVFTGDCSGCYNSRGACGPEISGLGVTESQVDAAGGDSPCGRIYLQFHDASAACMRIVNQCSWVKQQRADIRLADAEERVSAARAALQNAWAERDSCEDIDELTCRDCGRTTASGDRPLQVLGGAAQDIKAK